ncbi:MAG: IS4 family transposase, partial [Planctomycetes bacterium]|nr:IS4 family transposase [Planctomycetota bacterium]
VRWQIEVWHKVLKSGCKVEACQLESGDRLIRYLTLKSVIAWKLFWLTHLNRTQPDAPCTVILTNQEWQALYATIHKTLDLPDDVPTVREATHWIAQLGGFLGRAGDGEPGVTVLWRGWQRLQDFVRFWRIVQQE